MPAIEKECDIEQGYNLTRDNQKRIGHLTFLKIGTKTFAADQKVKVPGTFADEQVVAVLSAVNWEGGYAKPIQLVGNLSTKNKQDLSLLVHQDLSNTEVDFKFNVYEYDPAKKEWFKCFFAEETLLGLVNSEGGELKIAVSDAPGDEVTSPQNYQLDLTVMPLEQEQGVHFATKKGAPVVLKWGVEVK